MAINIFSGSSGPKRSGGLAAGASSRAQNAKQALTAPASGVSSDSGSTAVASTGILSKVGNLAKKALPLAAKYLPGVAGTVAKLAENVFNDPEWWQSVPGSGVTLNVPLQDQAMGHLDAGPIKSFTDIQEFAEVRAIRPPFMEFPSLESGAMASAGYVFQPSDNMVTQYLMPEIRKVANAVVLQDANDYATVLASHATIYALWRNLKKYDFLLKHGQTYLPNTNDVAFPILQVANAAYLQSTINRLEEYLRANVRIPHTLCEYLAWRFGRIYKANSSAKSTCVLYNVLSMGAPLSHYDDLITRLMNVISSTPELQKANADLYNAYASHDMEVEIADETQFSYDKKEFLLRTNQNFATDFDEERTALYDTSVVMLDSDMDNPTTFMSSTVSTTGKDGAGKRTVLFPTLCVIFWTYVTDVAHFGTFVLSGTTGAPVSADRWPEWIVPALSSNNWRATYHFEGYSPLGAAGKSPNGNKYRVVSRLDSSLVLALCKATELYNAGVFQAAVQIKGDVPTSAQGLFRTTSDTIQYDGPNGWTDLPFAQGYQTITAGGKTFEVRIVNFDATMLAQDTGLVPFEVMANEHVFAFANLVDITRTSSLSYKKAEKLVAKDVANMVDTMDVATAK
jgi:hypothetical protein